MLQNVGSNSFWVLVLVIFSITFVASNLDTLICHRISCFSAESFALMIAAVVPNQVTSHTPIVTTQA
jgi:hypothetical protein